MAVLGVGDGLLIITICANTVLTFFEGRALFYFILFLELGIKPRAASSPLPLSYIPTSQLLNFFVYMLSSYFENNC
jgi:hypothetical protein